jgi:clan AA aspartic protease
MIGRVDSGGRALLTAELRAEEFGEPMEVDAWVDTGFTGELVLPRSLIETLGLKSPGKVRAVLADGSTVECDSYQCWMSWFGEDHLLEVVANDGDHPLLGVGLLVGRDLHVSYSAMTVLVE